MSIETQRASEWRTNTKDPLPIAPKHARVPNQTFHTIVLKPKKCLCSLFCWFVDTQGAEGSVEEFNTPCVCPDSHRRPQDRLLLVVAASALQCQQTAVTFYALYVSRCVHVIAKRAWNIQSQLQNGVIHVDMCYMCALAKHCLATTITWELCNFREHRQPTSCHSVALWQWQTSTQGLIRKMQNCSRIVCTKT